MGNMEKKQHTVYKNSKGQVVPSCTTILQVLNVPTLIYWSNKIGRRGKDYGNEMASYGRIGTFTHALIEKYFKGDLDDFREKMDVCNDNEKAQAYKAYSNFLRWTTENEFELLESEIKLVSDSLNFGGTIDFVGIINGKIVILDFKTSNYFNKKMFLQLAGYMHLLLEHGYEIEGVMILKLSKTKDEFLVMEKSCDELEQYSKLFRFCLATHKLNEKIEKEWEWKKGD